MLALHDTASGRVEALELIAGQPVGLYVCGPTVYAPPHLGHGRLILVFDVLRRWLEHGGSEVRHVENVTDVDDKIIERAQRTGVSPAEVAAEAEAQWWAAADRLGALRPSAAPHATEWIAEMIELIGELMARGAAYSTSEGVYLDTTTVSDYGLLKHQELDSLRVGARVARSGEKRSDFDFALWKAAKPDEPRWEAPFGPGRPGWHSECVAMAFGLLGEGFLLHGGGSDLIFPHHENERAQAVALGRPFARHWVHGGLLTVSGEKMSKSLGNFTTLDDLFASSDPRALRLLVLRAHYRSPLEVRPELLEDATRAIERIEALASRVDEAVRAREGSSSAQAEALAAEVAAAMDDDLDTPRATSALFRGARQANVLLDSGDVAGGIALGAAVQEGFAVLGLLAATRQMDQPDEGAIELLRRREAARAAGDFAAADALRDELGYRGWRVEDGAGGSRLRR